MCASWSREQAATSERASSKRSPQLDFAKTEWATADVAESDLVRLFRGADAVVHLAWLIQPTRDPSLLWHVNVEGSTRVFRAVADAGVPVLVYASSIGAYSPGPKNRAVDERWPTGGVRTNEYSREKVEVERRLDRFERERRTTRVVRLRPALIFKRESATEQRRLFAGPFAPASLLRPGGIPFVPRIRGISFQAVHSNDVGNAYRLAVVRDVRGPFNIAAPSLLDLTTIARMLDARTIPLSARAARALVGLAFAGLVSPLPQDWLDLGLAAPLLDTSRAREELGWSPRRSGEDAIADFLGGLRDGAGLETPPLAPDTTPARVRELAGGLGQRDR
jgi:nucleoside-diphosphate-sugar epimerase